MEYRPDPRTSALLTARLIKAGRDLIGWSQEELARNARVHRNSVSRAESAAPDVKANTLYQIFSALEAGGVLFLSATDLHGEGVCLRVAFNMQPQ